jgi:Fe-Mn family superoxide dismutase
MMIQHAVSSGLARLGALALALAATTWSFAQNKPAPKTAEAVTYTLGKLPYAYNALEPVIDAQTMQIHHTKHHQAYVDNLNKALAGTSWAALLLEEMFQKTAQLPPAIRNNGGGHYNHTLFWSVMAPVKDVGKPSAALAAAINKSFGSMEKLQEQFNAAAATRFGSGWAWLIVQNDGTLAVTSTANQDNPLMEVAEKQGYPLLGLDVWEHAYYLKYQNRRGDYSKEWWRIVNWTEVSRRFAQKPKMF